MDAGKQLEMARREVEVMTRVAQEFAKRDVEHRTAMLRLLDPNDLGNCVTREVRDLVRGLLFKSQV
jgi:hypothetical protein